MGHYSAKLGTANFLCIITNRMTKILLHRVEKSIDTAAAWLWMLWSITGLPDDPQRDMQIKERWVIVSVRYQLKSRNNCVGHGLFSKNISTTNTGI